MNLEILTLSSMDSLLTFLKFLHQFQSIKRIILKTDSEEYENDVEHSYQLAMAAWYLIDRDKLPLDLNLVLKYALAHDLVEAYAGDTYIFGSKEELASKEKREQEALERIEKEFPEFTELAPLIHAYESRADEESKFVYSLDKILGPANLYLDNGRLWKRSNISYDQLMVAKVDKTKVSPIAHPYWLELEKKLTAEKGRLFPE